jgi:hypothetical protein
MKSERRVLLFVGSIFVSCCHGLIVTDVLSPELNRRHILFGGATFGVVPFPAYATASMDATEAIRRSAANIPGYGQTDVFYPSSLAGSWTMTRDVEREGREPLRLTYSFRFVQSIEDDGVVADRGFNQAELEKAILRAVKGNDESGAVRSYEWARTNPNDLRLVFSDGFKKEIKVTKRATERSDTTVSSSEFQRLTQEDTKGIPQISARRVLTKWKVLNDITVEGLEIVYSMPGGDPMTAGVATAPSVLSKSRLSLKRS